MLPLNSFVFLLNVSQFLSEFGFPADDDDKGEDDEDIFVEFGCTEYGDVVSVVDEDASTQFGCTANNDLPGHQEESARIGCCSSRIRLVNTAFE